MTPALAIFVKTPGLSPIKTRLAQGIGAGAAIEFHRLAAAAVAATVRACGDELAPYWAVAEAAAENGTAWPGFDRLWQGEGELGERLHRVYATLLERHGGALMVGADSPQLTPALLQDAARQLRRDPFVIGPAKDGGFWLFGGREPLAAATWTSVRYSRPDTAASLIHALPPGHRLARLPTLSDVDTIADLDHLLETLRRAPIDLPEHQTLAAWLLVRRNAAVTGAEH